jgi:copper chaperone CopZ
LGKIKRGNVMETTQISIEGMMCDACVRAVTQALTDLPGVRSATVGLTDHQAVVSYDPTLVSMAQMQAAIEEEGYEVSGKG